MKHEEIKKLFNELKYENEEEFINEFIKLLQQIFYSRTSFVKNTGDDSKRDEFFIELKRKFIESYNSYKSRNEDNSKISEIIKYIGCGHSSLAFQIGDLVIKVSKQKYDSNPSRLKDVTGLIPVFYYSDSEVGKNEHYSITITPYVEMCENLGEGLYEVYKDKRIQGYVWNDPTEDNVGIIIKDFVFNNQVYKKGDRVIIDLEDFTFVGEETPDYVWDFITYEAYNSKTYTFEERYSKEMGKIIK